MGRQPHDVTRRVTATDGSLTRRRVLQAAAGVAAVSGAGPALAQSSNDYGGWFDNVSNHDGTTVEETGVDEVTITVGASGNGGAFAFGPAAVRIPPGTTVVWEWTGNGGSHNVVAEDGTFESALLGEPGATYEYTFEEPGVYKYACTPHRMMGMRGAVVGTGGSFGNGSDTSGTETVAGGGEAGGDGGGSLSPGAGTVGVSLLLAFLSPLGLAALLRRRTSKSQTTARHPQAGD